jgi:predicted dehydrogenase
LSWRRRKKRASRAGSAISGKEIRVALLGYGLGGAVFHAPLIAATPGLRLDYVVTSNPDRREQARRAHRDATLLDSADELWKRADDVDLAVVATPNRAHVPLARSALEVGLAVVVDKPFAPTSAAAREVTDEAQRRGQMLTVFQNRRWDGDMLTLQRLLAENALGPVLRFESRYERWRPELKAGWREFAAAEEAGGILYDLGSHLIDQALVLFGPVSSVYAELDRRRPGAEVDDDAFVALTHESGTHSHLWMNAVAAQLGPRMRVLGRHAAYTKYGLDPQEEALRAGGRPGTPGWGEEPRECWGLVGAGDDLRPVKTEPGAYERFYEGVVAALQEGAPPPVDPRDSIAVLEIIEAARAGGNGGKPGV